MKLRPRALRVIAIAALALSSVPAGLRPALAQARASASAGARSPREPLLAQNHPTQAGPGGAASVQEQPIGLPRVRDYETTPELRDIYFDFGTAAIRPDDVKILNANAAWLRAHPSYLVLIEGYCDNRGATTAKNEFNMDLGEQRAEAAMKYLIEHGVHPNRIITLSYGAERPLCTEESELCWSQNRRSRFLVKPR
jgi:outer membrane protein OmpA-like peptidoglycan-associated protein